VLSIRHAVMGVKIWMVVFLGVAAAILGVQLFSVVCSGPVCSADDPQKQCTTFVLFVLSAAVPLAVICFLVHSLASGMDKLSEVSVRLFARRVALATSARVFLDLITVITLSFHTQHDTFGGVIIFLYVVYFLILFIIKAVVCGCFLCGMRSVELVCADQSKVDASLGTSTAGVAARADV